MMIQRLIAVVMILGSSMLTAWASGDIAFPAILCMLGLLGVQRRFAWDIRPERHFITPLLLLLLAVLFALHCHYAHVRTDQAAAFAWQTIARYFLASMILLLFLRPQYGGRRTEGRGRRRPPSSVLCPPIGGLPASLGLFHLASVLAAGQVLLLDDRYVVFRLSALLSVTLVLLYAMAGTQEEEGKKVRTGERRGNPSWLPSEGQAQGPAPTPSYPPTFLPSGLHASRFANGAALLLIAINLGWIGGSVLFRYVEVINFLPTWLSRGAIALEATGAEAARVGFSTSGKLSTVLAIKEEADTAPVLTVTGSNPGYLRAMAFETYNQSAWHDLSYREALTGEQNTPFGVTILSRMYLFRLHEAQTSREVIVRHESSVGEAMFTPLGTHLVEAPFQFMMRDDDEIVNSPHVRNRHSYRAGYTATAVGRPPAGSQLRRMLESPRPLDLRRIRPLVNRIFAGCTTTAQKIEAVTRYFHTNYTYQLGLEVPLDQDPLNYFLLEAASGYCEYFASGAAVLLRLVGVPTRYVTGFLVTEQGDDRRTWIARNMDAHAWVEAWDREQQQWVIVEATTQEGLEDVSLADELARGAGSGRPFLTQLAQALYEYGLLGVLGWLFVSHGLATGVGLALLFLGAAVFVARRSSSDRRPRRAAGDERQVMLRKLLAFVDRQARRRGYRRRAEETLHAFADRIRGSWPVPRDPGHGSGVTGHGSPVTRDEERGTSDGPRLADWYLRYAGLRYCRALDPAHVTHLQRLAHELRRRL